MPDNEIVAAMEPHLRQWNSCNCRICKTDRIAVGQAALRAALEAAGVTEAQIEFARTKALLPWWQDKLDPESKSFFAMIRATYGEGA